MPGLALDSISKRFGPLTAVEDVDLDLPAGKFISFLGPSGCGKTTLLRLIAGLETPSSGRVMLDDRDITALPTHQRNIGMVFQSLALFPHLNVRNNITYGLRIRGMSKAECRRRAGELLDMVRLPGVEERDIKQLSGGQRQRVAMARALALEPTLFLLDEPLSALDAKLREEMQVELRMLQERLGITTIIVTHDQREAMTMSDLVVVMSTAKVQQVGPPLEIYRSPATAFVADFIGSSNLVDAACVDVATVCIGESEFTVPAVPEGARAGDALTLTIRPEDVHILPSGDGATNRLPGRVSFVRDVGASVEFFVRCGDIEVVSISAPKDRPQARPGDEVMVELPAESCVVVRR